MESYSKDNKESIFPFDPEILPGSKKKSTPSCLKNHLLIPQQPGPVHCHMIKRAACQQPGDPFANRYPQ